MEVSEKDKTTEEQNSNNKLVDVDEYIIHVGEFGKRQVILQIMLFLMVVPIGSHAFLIVFTANNPAWRCTGLNPECNNTGQVFDIGHEYYDHRCKLNNRSSWQFVRPKKFSIVTEWDLVCQKRELSYFASSVFFLGGIIGTLVLGYLSDRFVPESVRWLRVNGRLDEAEEYMWARVFVCLCGKLAITLSILTIMIWSGELIPTVVRSQGLSLLNLSAALGSFCAPWIAQWLRHFHAVAPYVAMGAIAIISTSLCTFLHETNGEPTKEVLTFDRKDNVLDIEMPSVIENPSADETEVELKAR
eukprot:gene5283-biopygen4317